MYRTKILFKFGGIIRRLLRLFPNPDIPKHQPDTNFRLVYFCGDMGIDYLIASINSVRLSWKQFPKILIITDGFPPDEVRTRLGRWSERFEIITWEACAGFFKDPKFTNVVNYARQQLWGRKFLSLLYSIYHYRTLYSDTDVLWYEDPSVLFPKREDGFTLIMSSDVEFSYDKHLLDCMAVTSDQLKPLNAGVIYGHGDLSIFPEWETLTRSLLDCRTNFSEQTAMAIIATRLGSSWPIETVFMDIKDYSRIFDYSPIRHRGIIARHYVSVKPWLFWRDYIILLATSTIAFLIRRSK
jgi:hypothetical protein